VELAGEAVLAEILTLLAVLAVALQTHMAVAVAGRLQCLEMVAMAVHIRVAHQAEVVLVAVARLLMAIKVWLGVHHNLLVAVAVLQYMALMV